MKLFLASEAKHPDSISHLEKFVHGLKGKRIVYIPTAANGEGYGSWKQGESINIARNHGATLDIVELENHSSPEIKSIIGQPDIIWVAGGSVGYLLYWMRRRELNKTLPELLNNGTIYVGSSAGSMACSRTQLLLDIYIGETEPGASIIPGLGLIDFEIYPHYEDHLYTQIRNMWTGGKLYLLKNGEVITIVDGRVQVLGIERTLPL